MAVSLALRIPCLSDHLQLRLRRQFLHPYHQELPRELCHPLLLFQANLPQTLVALLISHARLLHRHHHRRKLRRHSTMMKIMILSTTTPLLLLLAQFLLFPAIHNPLRHRADNLKIYIRLRSRHLHTSLPQTTELLPVCRRDVLRPGILWTLPDN